MVLSRDWRTILGVGIERASWRRLGIVAVRRSCLGRKRTKRLAMSTKELCSLRVDIWTRATVWTESHISHVWVNSVSWDKSLSLGGDWSEDALLLETLAIRAASFGILIKARATNLSQG
jgi:hypothetical protein